MPSAALLIGCKPDDNNYGAAMMARTIIGALPDSVSVVFSLDRHKDIRIIIDASGYCYADHLPWRESRLRMHEQAFKILPRIPTVFMPQAYGPLEPSLAKRFIALLHSECAVYCRDRVSQCHLRAVGLEAPIVDDVAFCAPTPRAESGRQWLAAHLPNWRDDQPLGLVVPNRHCVQRMGHLYVERLRTAMQSLAALSYRAVLLRHNRLPESLPADLQREELWCDDVEMTRHVIASAAVLYGSRFHSLVAALRAGVPVLADGWAPKYGCLLEQWECGEYLVGATDDGNAVSRILHQMVEVRETVAARLRRLLPLKRANARTPIDKVIHHARS